MAQANQADFLGEGTVDPFAGLAPAEDPSMQEARRRQELQRSATATANINQGARAGEGPDYSSMTSAQLISRRAAGEAISDEQILAAKRLEKQNHDAMNGIGYKALTYGTLAAPWLITGGAAEAGALGFGEGTGSISAANAGLASSESAAASAPAAVGYAAESAPLTMASPSVAGASGATPAAAAPAAAAAGSVPGWLSGLSAAGYKGLEIAAPFLIQAALGGETKEDKALKAKQEQLAQEAQIRQGQQQDARMNQLGQQLLAFNPTNQRLAQVFGPSAAFSPEQMATMVQGQPPPQNPALENYHGTDPKIQAQVEEYIRRKQEFDAAEASRRAMMLSGTTPVGPAQPGVQMGAPQAARRF